MADVRQAEASLKKKALKVVFVLFLFFLNKVNVIVRLQEPDYSTRFKSLRLLCSNISRAAQLALTSGSF